MNNRMRSAIAMSSSSDSIKDVILKRGGYILALVAVVVALVSDLDWTMAWSYGCMVVINQIIIMFFLVPDSLRTAKGRTEYKDKAHYDLIALYVPAGIWIAAGLDMRFAWSPEVPFLLEIAALFIALTGFSLATGSQNECSPTSDSVPDGREHAVVTSGAYRFVRHPDYAGVILYYLAVPLILGSLWALIPALLGAVLISACAACEDRRLLDASDAYRAYAEQVHYRLFPGIW